MSYREEVVRRAPPRPWVTRSRLALGCVGVLAAALAGAQEWQTNPRVELGYMWDDNYRLNLSPAEIEVSGPFIDAELEFRKASQVNEFSLLPRIRTTYFPDETDEDSTDYFLRLRHLHRTERSQLRLNASFTDETVATTEQPNADLLFGATPSLGDTEGADSGRTQVRNRRQLFDFAPLYTHDLAERSRIEVGGRYRDVGFDTAVPNSQVAYSEAGVNVGYTHLLTQRTSLTARGITSWYEPDIAGYKAFGYGVQGEWSTEPTETSRTYARIGAQRTEIDRGRTVRSGTDYLAAIGGEWSGEVHSTVAEFSRTVGPTASGFVVQRDQVRMRFLRDFSERVQGFVGIRGIRDNAAEARVVYAERRYANGDIGLEYALSQTWSVTGSYDYTWQEFADEATSRTSQGISLALVYQPPRRQGSR